jgi:hypothetical protein
MKKLFIKLLLFKISFVCFYLVVICIWGDYVPDVFKENLNYKRGSKGYLFSRVLDAKSTEDVDLLFLGSSHSYRGFDTRIFEKHSFRTFNFGSSAQTPIQTKLLLDRYLKQLKPKKIIFEVNPASFVNDGVESAIDLISNDRNTVESVKMAFELKHIKVFNALIYGFYNDFLEREKNFTEKRENKEDMYIKGGYVESKLRFYKVHLDTMPRTWKWNESQFKAFESIYQKIKEEGIELILVQAPITKSTYSLYTNNHEFDQRLSKFGNYYNFNTIIKLDDERHFEDFHHLNQNGVEEFNAYFIENILKKK